MPPRRYEIYLAKISLRESQDLRPWVVIADPVRDPLDPRKWLVVIAPISSHLDLMEGSRDFLIDSGAPDFGSTGLRRSAYVIGNRPARVSLERLQRRLGNLSGEMLVEFKEWCGD